MSDLILKTGGQIHLGWKEFTVRRSLKMHANSFECSLTNNWRGLAVPRLTVPDSPFELLLDGEHVISGYIDDVPSNYDAETHVVKVSGRSKVRELIDCSGIHPARSNQTLKLLAEWVCDFFGLKVVIDAGVKIGAPFETAVIDPGESYMEFLKRHADQRGVILSDTPEGHLLITTAGKEKAPTALVLGENVLSASATNTVRDRFGTYFIIGQQSGSDAAFGAAAVDVRATVIDQHVRSARTKVIEPPDGVNIGDVKRYGESVRNIRFGESQAITYTVSGFKHEEGLWQPNTLVDVYDNYMGLSAERLIVDVENSLDKKSITRLTVIPVEALDMVPLPVEVSSPWAVKK